MVRAEAIATTFFGQPADSIEALLGLGSVNEIFVAQCEGKKIIVRLPKPEDRERAGAFYEKESWCLEQAASLGVPGPLVLQLGICDSWPFQIQSFAEGVNGEQSNLDPIVFWQTLGDYARRFHKIPLTGFGENLAEFFTLKGRTRWHEFIDYNLNSLTPEDPLLALGVYESSQRDEIHAHFTAVRQHPFRLGLCHGDLAPRNTIVAPDGTLVLLDWGCAEAHLVPHYELLHIPGEHRAAFLDGYGWPSAERAALLAEIEALALLKSFDLVRWALDRCPARVTELAEKARQQRYDR